MKRILDLLFVLLLVTSFCAAVFAQNTSTVLCRLCKEPNLIKNAFCTSCGEKLMSAHTKEQNEAAPQYRQPVRLFSIPMAFALPQSHVMLAFGNNFGIQSGESILGTAAIGIEGVGEIEISTAGLVSSIVTNAPGLRTAGMTIHAFAEDEILPAIGIAIRSSNDWEREERNAQAVAVSDQASYDVGMRSLNLESRLTTLSVFAGKHLSTTTALHAGIGLADVRHRNVYAGFVSPLMTVSDNSERRLNQWQAFGGVSTVLNERTTVMGEVQTIPLLAYSVNKGGIQLNRMYVAVAGVRFSLNPSWSLDSGIRYQSNFIGLADVQFRVSMNGMFVL